MSTLLEIEAAAELLPLEQQVELVRVLTAPLHSANMWIGSADQFYTCPISELGFVRISLSKAYGASWDETQEALSRLHRRSGYKFLADDVDGLSLPETGSKDTTDAHRVVIAKRHGLKLATLDVVLIAKAWAFGIAENPLVRLVKSS